MRTYRLFKSPTGEVVRVRMGFSWRAFFIGSLKAIVRRVWLIAIVAALFAFNAANLTGAPTGNSRTIALAVALLCVYAVYMLFCGVNGSRWLVDSLRRRGFTMVGEEQR